MSGFSLPLTRLVHENLSIIMCFAYSQRPLEAMMCRNFGGRHKYLEKALFDLSAGRAEKACLELALFLRMADDEISISRYHAATSSAINCGKLTIKDGTERKLPFREVANKIIHSVRLEWDLLREPDPILICYSRDDEKWLRAEIDWVGVSSVCGQLMGCP